MGTLILVTGGSRSGKSDFAQQRAEEIPGSRLFIATCPSTDMSDKEMDARIHRHQKDRQGKGWQTIEEPLQVAQRLSDCEPNSTILIDCLTLWINNLMYAAEMNGQQVNEEQIKEQAKLLARAANRHRGTVIMVTNEVGLGIVPDNPVARLYRDLVGRCNQVMGRAADQVFLVTCGIPQQIK